VTRPRAPRPPLEDVDLGDLPGEIAPIDDDELRRRTALATSFESPSFVARGTEAGHIRLVRTASGRVDADRGRAGPPQVGEGSEPVRPPEVSGTPPAHGEAPRRRRSEEPNFTVRLPDYVQQALRMRAVSDRTTVRLTLLRLLRDAGYHVDDQDMTDDRGIVAKMRSKAQRPD
jgi:hypothetical protein